MSSTVLVLFITLYSITNVVRCNVHYVTPDDDIDDSCCFNNSSCSQCYNLQYYLLNISEYFTSDTKLHFLPGLHYLPTNLVIQNVGNISLIGSRHTTIYCTGLYHIILENCSNVTMKDIVITECGLNSPPGVIVLTPLGSTKFFLYTIELYYCSSVTMTNIGIISRTKYDAVMNVNTMGNSHFII